MLITHLKTSPKIMNPHSLLRNSLCLLLALVSLNCASQKTVPVTNREVLIPGDLVQVSVFGEPELSQEVEISENGRVDLPLIGEVSLQGLTLEQASEEVRARYEKDYLREAYVRVTAVRPGISASR